MEFLTTSLQSDDVLAALFEDNNNEDVFEVRMLELLGYRRGVAEMYAIHRTARLPGVFVLEEYGVHYHNSFFRFVGRDIHRLQQAFGISEFINVPYYGIVPGLEIVCLLLRRFAFPARWVDLQLMFRHDFGAMSRMFKWGVAHLATRYEEVLYWQERVMTRKRLMEYSLAVMMKGAPIPNVWSFIDGTFLRTCRPGQGK